jgi:hypothetical protein
MAMKEGCVPTILKVDNPDDGVPKREEYYSRF